MVHSKITKYEFSSIMDYIISVINPKEKESAFIEKENYWKNFVNKKNNTNQTY